MYRSSDAEVHSACAFFFDGANEALLPLPPSKLSLPSSSPLRRTLPLRTSTVAPSDVRVLQLSSSRISWIRSLSLSPLCLATTTATAKLPRRDQRVQFPQYICLRHVHRLQILPVQLLPHERLPHHRRQGQIQRYV